MKPIYVTFLNGLDVEALAFQDDEILEAIESGGLTHDRILIDSTSGNTGVAYSLVDAKHILLGFE